MKWSNRITAKIHYTNGFTRGFWLGLKLRETIAQSDSLTALAFYLLGTVITLLLVLVR